MELNQIREQIDKIDDNIAKLYDERMKLVGQVSEAKKQSGKDSRSATSPKTARRTTIDVSLIPCRLYWSAEQLLLSA